MTNVHIFQVNKKRGKKHVHGEARTQDIEIKICFLPLVDVTYVEILTKWWSHVQTRFAYRPFPPREWQFSELSRYLSRQHFLQVNAGKSWFLIFFGDGSNGYIRGWFRCHGIHVDVMTGSLSISRTFLWLPRPTVVVDTWRF